MRKTRLRCRFWTVLSLVQVFLFFKFNSFVTKYLQSKVLFQRYGAYLICFYWFQAEVDRTLLGTKTDFFVTTTYDYQPLKVVAKNFILEAEDVLDLPLLRLQYNRR